MEKGLKYLYRVEKNPLLLSQDYDFLRRSLVVLLRNRHTWIADFDYLHIDIYEDLRLCFFLVVLTEEDITISPVPSECLSIWGKTVKQVLSQATENAQTFSQIYLSLIASALHNYRSSSISFNNDREAREAKKQIGNKIDVLLVKSLYEGSISLLLPGTQARLASLFGGDYYVSLLTADTCVVHSIKDMDIDQLMDSIDSAGSETPYGTLSRYPLKYDSKRKIMKVIKR